MNSESTQVSVPGVCPANVSDLRDGSMAKVVGVLGAVPHLLLSPVTRTPCVYFRVEVTRDMERDGRIRTWVRRAMKHTGAIQIDDGTGVVMVDLKGSVVLPSRRVTTAAHGADQLTFHNLWPIRELMSWSRPSQPDARCVGIRWREEVLVPGDKVTAYGRVQHQRGGGFYRGARSSPVLSADNTFVLVTDDPRA
jgi:hypothetical protein